MTVFRTPWDTEPAAISGPGRPPESKPAPKPRGRRPAAASPLASAAPAWLWHHLTITGPAADVAAFAAAARGPGIIPWHLDHGQTEEDIFNLAVPPRNGRRSLTAEGCHILARQFRETIAAREMKAAALTGQSTACPLDLHVLLPVPGLILRHGPAAPESLAWLMRHWGTRDSLRKIVVRPNPSPGRRLPGGYSVISYGFFTSGDTPAAAVTALATRWPAARFVLTPLPAG